MKWEKIFGGKWSFLNCSILADIHARIIKDVFGSGPDNIVFVFREGYSSCYYSVDNLQRWQNYLINAIFENYFLPNQMAVECNEIADQLRDLMRNSKNPLNNFSTFVDVLYEFIPSYLFVKQAIVKADKKTFDKYVKIFEESRKYTETVWDEFEVFLDNLCEIIGKQENIEPKLIKHCTFYEIENYIERGDLPENEILKKRYIFSALHQIKDKKKIFLGNEAKKFENMIISSNENFLKGEIIYRGIAKGKARIVLDPRKIKQFDKGDILITQMTRPDYEYLMAKSSAIVTDAGGILCHAAIVAREMKKPCVIGTNIATSFFNEGEIIEVDAYKGVVRRK